MTGFFPAIAARRGGAPAIAYKDIWGEGSFGAAARDDLFFFSFEQGNVVPPAELRLAPPHARSGFSLIRRVGTAPPDGGPPPTFDDAELAPHVELSCGVLAGADPLAILASVVTPAVPHHRGAARG